MQQVNPPRNHKEDLDLRTQVHDHKVFKTQQIFRLSLIIMIVAVWLIQTAYITYFAVDDPLILDDIEKFTLLIGVTGLVVDRVITHLWGETKNGNK